MGESGGVVFPDPGFHIAVLGALLDAGVLDEESLEAKLDGIDTDLDEDGRLRAGMARLHAIEIDSSQLARIERIDFDGGNDIYMLLERKSDVETGGEDDTYALRSLEGIGKIVALKSIDLDGHGYREEALDLRPLENHPTLASVLLTGTCSGAAALETLGKLEKLSLGYSKIDDDSVAERLAKRGVTVQK